MVRPVKANEREKWLGIRAKGEYRYVLKRGVWWGLWFGVGHFIFGIISKSYLSYGWDLFIYDRTFTTIYFFLCGCLIGIWEWRRNEKKYSQPASTDEA